MLDAEEIYGLLLSSYGKPEWWSDDPYTVIFQSVLVQNTSWSSVKKTTALFHYELSAESIDSLDAEILMNKIRSCGFAKRKAETIKALTSWYLSYEGAIEKLSTEALRKELLSFRGVGEETADVILVYALLRPSFIIDAYTRRFLERIGYHFKNDEERRSFLTASLEKDVFIYGSFHWLLLEHSIMHCLKKPKCSGCVFSQLCRFEKSS